MRKLKLTRDLLLTAGLALALAACNGGDTDGGPASDEDFHGTQFVPDDSNTGTITLKLKEDHIQISQIAGFEVLVRDSNNQPVPNVRIACDTELGVAIIEPTTGLEITDSGGHVSGKIGCALPGSYQMACRLPTGGNFRDFKTVVCTGDIPTGFNGFPGAAGGGLGGGSQISDDGGTGGTNTNGVRVTSLTTVDVGGQDTPQVDTLQGLCGTDDPTTAVDDRTAEPFTDTSIHIKVINNTNSLIRFSTLQYKVPNIDATGRDFTSNKIALVGEAAVDSNGGVGDFTVLAFSAGAFGGQGRLFFAGSSTPISTQLGFKNVSVTLRGTNSLGQDVVVTGTTVLSFNTYDHCSS